MSSQTDVFVVGGGPAGLAAAIAAALRGFRVTVADSQRPPIDKACGEGLLPDGVAALSRLGIDLNSRLGLPFAGLQFRDGSSVATARFPRRSAFGIRRIVLQQLLLDRAAQLGVRFCWGARVTEITSTDAQLPGERISFRWLIGADGRRSMIRKWARLDSQRLGPWRFGFRRHFSLAPWSDVVEVHWGDRWQMVLTPTGAREVCVSLFTGDPHFRVADALASIPRFATRFARACALTPELGGITALHRAGAVWSGPVALVGDASCTVDGISGQGLSLALQQAFPLADAMASGNLDSYSAAHGRIVRTATRITRLLLFLGRHPSLRRRALRLLERQPRFFSRLLAAHAGEAAPDPLGARDIVGLGIEILRVGGHALP
ncbi:MAG: FAD-dependent monooxygenase [Candidatus Acidiferrales bacterium]